MKEKGKGKAQRRAAARRGEHAFASSAERLALETEMLLAPELGEASKKRQKRAPKSRPVSRKSASEAAPAEPKAKAAASKSEPKAKSAKPKAKSAVPNGEPRSRRAQAKAKPESRSAAPRTEQTAASAAKGGKGGNESARGATATTDTTSIRSTQRAKGRTVRNKKQMPLRVMCLGGLEEIGKNMTVLEYGEDILIIDCGMGFPDDDMPGVDLVIPDVSYLVANAHRIRGILITHGHEDHIGAVPYILRQIDVPIYGTRLSLGIIEGKLDELPPPNVPELRTVEAGESVSLGVFRAEFIHVNHSIADACAIAIHTPIGIVYHSGDFKIDVSPIDGQIMDLTRIGELGREGVTLLLCESTNAERPGFTASERTVGSSLERIFAQYENKRLIIATFSSNVHRVQQIINTSHKHGRKVAILGRSMTNVIGAAVELGYMDLPQGVLIDVGEMKRYKPGEITLITTGSQGEPMSALYRIAFAEHDRVKLTTDDVVVLSAHAIPGNEKLVGRIVNALVHSGVRVVNDSVEDVHVSGHACAEEIKLLMALLRPKFFMPIHGEYRHLYANKDIAEFMGISPDRIFISNIGRVLEVTRDCAKFAGEIPSGKVLVDGAGVGDIGSVVLRDRKHLAEDGLVVVVATLDMEGRYILSGPDIVSRGFVYVKESEDLMNEVRAVAVSALNRILEKRLTDWTHIKGIIRDDIAKFIFRATKRKPMILPIIMDI